MTTSQRIAYQPALDGVRALAVAVVLLYHARVPGFGAGYLGVSVFFTLSGFLITLLLLREHRSTGSIDVAAFYARRLRRLLPASVVTIAVIAVLAATTDLFAGVASMRRQIIGSLLQVANWVFLADEGSYQERLAGAAGAVSPLEHFWSLSIEEQFYWVWPTGVLGLFALVTSHRRRTVALGLLTAVSVAAAPLVASVWGGEAAYWATPARLSEILVGGLLAMMVADRTLPARWAMTAPIGLLALAVFVVTFPGPDRVAGAGILPIVALVSGLLILGLQVEGPLRAGLSAPPLVWLGRISYGVYLYHWPIFVIVDADRLGVSGPALFVVRIALTLLVAQVSYALIEFPIRHRRPRWSRPTFGLAGAVTAAMLIAAWVIVPRTDSSYWEIDSATVEAAAIDVGDAGRSLQPSPTRAPADAGPTAAASTPAVSTPAASTPAASTPAASTPAASTPAAPTAAVPTAVPITESAAGSTITPATPATSATSTSSTLPPIPELTRPVRVVVTGDSTANALGAGVLLWAADHPDLAQAEIVAAPGCGFLRGGEIRRGDDVESTDDCDAWAGESLLPAIERTQPDLVVVMVTAWDLIDRRWDTDELLHPTHPEFRRRLVDAYGGLIEDVTRLGAGRVALVQPPIADPYWLGRSDADDDASRHDVLTDVYSQLAADQPETVAVVPMAEWFTSAGLDEDRDLRPDGVHLSPAGAARLMEDRLGEHLIRFALGEGGR